MNSSSANLDGSNSAGAVTESSSASRKVTPRISVVLRGTQASLDNRLYAINWLDARPVWVYHLYNLLAYGRLMRLGGQAIFKAKTKEVLSGDETERRALLLIVSYPSVSPFLDLMSDKPFLLFSILRMLSVRRFSFVMQAATASVEFGVGGHYAVVHFDADDPNDDHEQLRIAAERNGVRLAFAGEKRVTLSHSRNGNETLIPFETPNTVVLAADSETQLTDFFKQDDFRDWASHTHQHFAALLDRTR